MDACFSIPDIENIYKCRYDLYVPIYTIYKYMYKHMLATVIQETHTNIYKHSPKKMPICTHRYVTLHYRCMAKKVPPYTELLDRSVQ